MVSVERNIVYCAAPTEEVKEENNMDTTRYPDSTYAIISKFAYLIGVPKNVFEKEHSTPKAEIYQEMEKDKNARIIRNLCMLRTAIEKNYNKVMTAFQYDLKNLHTLPELIPQESIQSLLNDGIDIVKANCRPSQYIINLNGNIANRINNCKPLFPIWLKWDYLRELFIMPNGMKDSGIKQAANEYYAHLSEYPYQVYMNWVGGEHGNILYNDKKFVTLLYEAHEDYFEDLSKVTDASFQTKDDIYRFLEMSKKCDIVVDCENSDPYKLCAMLNNLDQKALLNKIAKIILYDDVHTTTAWQILNEFTDIPVERILIERVKEEKSLVDMRLTTGTCREFFQNNVDSFLLASSDSDYWGLIPAMPEARFLVLIEDSKSSVLSRKVMEDSGITYSYLDDFCTGNSNQIKVSAMLREVQSELRNLVNFNIGDILIRAYENTRAGMSTAERQQFYDRYIRPMRLTVAADGQVSVSLGAA